MPPAIIMGVAAVASTAAAVSQYKDAKQAKKAAQKQQEIQKNVDNIRERQARIQAYRERMKAADAGNMAGVSMGGSSTERSSTVQTGINSINAQYGFNESFTNMLNGYQTASNNIKRPDGTRTALFSTIANIAGNTMGGNDMFADYTQSFFKK